MGVCVGCECGVWECVWGVSMGVCVGCECGVWECVWGVSGGYGSVCGV